MPSALPSVNYDRWSDTCDTLHAHTQVLGKLEVALAPPEPELQHAALRLTARGWETNPLTAPDGSGAFSVALDLRDHEAVVEHSTRGEGRVPLTPNRPVGDVTRDVIEAVRGLAGPVEINTKPQEVPWTAALDDDTEHASYDPDAVGDYFAAATAAAASLTEYRAPFRGRSTPVNAWWGTFDLAVNLFSGAPAEPPSDDFIMRNSMDAQEIAVGWWPGDTRYSKAAFFGFAYPAVDGFGEASIANAQWHEDLGLYILDWDEVRASDDPHGQGVQFAHAVFRHGCEVCNWPAPLAQSGEGTPPPIK